MVSWLPPTSTASSTLTSEGAVERPRRRAAGAALEPDQLELVRLAGQFRAGLLVADLAAGEALALLHDLRASAARWP